MKALYLIFYLLKSIVDFIFTTKVNSKRQIKIHSQPKNLNPTILLTI